MKKASSEFNNLTQQIKQELKSILLTLTLPAAGRADSHIQANGGN